MLICKKCDSRTIVEDIDLSPEGWKRKYLKCLKCGSRKVEEVPDNSTGTGVEVIRETLQDLSIRGPLAVFDKEVSVGTYNKKCEASGCEKKSWLKGLCHKHYIEKHGEYIPENPFKGPKKKAEKVETKQPVPETKGPETETNSVEYVSVDHKTIPLLQIFLEPELLDALTKKAKAEYRSVEMQAAYLINRGLDNG